MEIREHSRTYPILKRKVEQARYKNQEDMKYMIEIFYSAGSIFDFEHEEITKILLSAQPEDKAN